MQIQIIMKNAHLYFSDLSFTFCAFSVRNREKGAPPLAATDTTTTTTSSSMQPGSSGWQPNPGPQGWSGQSYPAVSHWQSQDLGWMQKQYEPQKPAQQVQQQPQQFPMQPHSSHQFTAPPPPQQQPGDSPQSLPLPSPLSSLPLHSPLSFANLTTPGDSFNLSSVLNSSVGSIQTSPAAADRNGQDKSEL